MAIENSVSNDFLSTFLDSIGVFDCRLPDVLNHASSHQSWIAIAAYPVCSTTRYLTSPGFRLPPTRCAQPRVISPVLDCSRFSLEQFKHSRLSAILTHTTGYSRGFPSKVRCTCDSLSFYTHKYKFFSKKACHLSELC